MGRVTSLSTAGYFSSGRRRWYALLMMPANHLEKKKINPRISDTNKPEDKKQQQQQQRSQKTKTGFRSKRYATDDLLFLTWLTY